MGLLRLARPWSRAALAGVWQGVELCQIVNILGAVFIAGAEAALLPRRQARHVAAGERPAREGVRRVIEELAVQPRLTAMPGGIERDRMHIHPAVARCPQFDPDREPVGLGHVPQAAERCQAGAEVTGIDREIKITVRAGLAADQHGDTPAAAYPVPHSGFAQRVQDLDDFRRVRQ